jgi:hypothetical protein
METQMKFASKMIGKMKEMAPNQSEAINTRAIEPPIRFVDPPVYGSLVNIIISNNKIYHT